MPPVQDISEAQLNELRRQWADSHKALAQRAKRDRDEIERLTHILHEREHESIQQVRAAAEGSGLTVAQVRPSPCQSLPSKAVQGST